MIPHLTAFEQADFVRGELILVDKPKGWTSFDAVNKIKSLIRHQLNLKKIKVGHSGTLDPMATGLLVICTGGWTKKLFELQGLDKKYEAEITLGIETDTYDAEGETINESSVPNLSLEEIKNVFEAFIGEIDQVPPSYSALKKEGKPLYELARAGKPVTPESRRVKVYDIDVISFEANKINLVVHCGSGFYVRSLAHDIGEKLGCGGHLSALRRTMVGDYSVRDAFSIEQIVRSVRT